MNDIQIFNNPEFGDIRTTYINETPWFCGKDIAEALGYTDSPKAIKQHCKKDGWVNYPVIDSLGRHQEAKFINEPNVYRLIIRSKLQAAERFEQWIFEEVLPTIRKTGAYGLQTTRPLTTDDYLNASRIIATAKRETLPYVLDFFQKAGLEIGRISQLPRVRYYTGSISDSVSDYLEGHDVVDRCSSDVYKEYVAYCLEKEVEPVNNIMFSKQVNAKLGTCTVCKKIDRISRRVFVEA